MQNVCRLEQVTKSYEGPKGERVAVLEGLSLDIPTDGITVLLGESGCGKTTLLRLLAQLEQADAGSITYYNQTGSVWRPRIGLVFQEPRLMPWLDVKHNITFHQDKPNWRQAQDLIELMGLGGFADAYPDTLSGGMASRVAIARALAYEPELLLMDEPFAALDYYTRRALEEEMIALYLRRQVGLIFVTHDVEEALLLGQQLVVMKPGAPPLLRQMKEAYPRRLESEALQAVKQEVLLMLDKGAEPSGHEAV